MESRYNNKECVQSIKAIHLAYINSKVKTNTNAYSCEYFAVNVER